MKNRFTYGKLIVALFLILVVHLTFGAITGKVDDRKNKFSLKNLNLMNRVYVMSSLRTNTFHYNGSSDIYHQNIGNQVQVQSMIRMGNGNTTYVYPYKYSVKVPKFKTPAPPSVR